MLFVRNERKQKRWLSLVNFNLSVPPTELDMTQGLFIVGILGEEEVVNEPKPAPLDYTGPRITWCKGSYASLSYVSRHVC